MIEGVAVSENLGKLGTNCKKNQDHCQSVKAHIYAECGRRCLEERSMTQCSIGVHGRSNL